MKSFSPLRAEEARPPISPNDREITNVAQHFTVRDGQIFHHYDADHWPRGVYVSPDEAERLLAQYLRSASATDWWAPHAQTRADQLAEAMRVAGISEQQHVEAA